MRKVVLHYHLFKNAGTSLDAAFKEYFKGDAWVTREFPAALRPNREEVRQWIADCPQASCFSSHTAVMPPPAIMGTQVLPVIFVRHPYDRIASAYAFERKQGGDGFGAVLARNTTLAGYIETRLSIPQDRQCRNFHIARFATMYDDKEGSEFERSQRAVDALPYIGIVEDFAGSLAILQDWLREEGFRDITLKPQEKNVSRDLQVSLDDRIAALREEIPPEVFALMEEANQDDLEIYRRCLARHKPS